MFIKMLGTRWVSPQGVRLRLFYKDHIYEVSRYCGSYLIAYGYAVEVESGMQESGSREPSFN